MWQIYTFRWMNFLENEAMSMFQEKAMLENSLCCKRVRCVSDITQSF